MSSSSVVETKCEPMDEENTVIPNSSTNINDEDPIVQQMDVFLTKNLAQNLNILQFPIRPLNRNYDNSTFIGAKFRPKQNKLDIELEINTRNENYSKPKGEQFALNVDGKLTNQISASNSRQKSKEPEKYFRSNLMDKLVFSSTEATLDQVNRLYHLGYIGEDDCLHLTPVNSILQMKPNFEYFDIYEKKVKDLKENTGVTSETDYSTEEEIEIKAEKAELVTLKYSNTNLQQQQQQQQAQKDQDENPILLRFHNLNEENSENLKTLLNCKVKSNRIEIDSNEEDFIRKLVEIEDISLNAVDKNQENELKMDAQ